jgi:hypothetical protein
MSSGQPIIKNTYVLERHTLWHVSRLGNVDTVRENWHAVKAPVPVLNCRGVFLSLGADLYRPAGLVPTPVQKGPVIKCEETLGGVLHPLHDECLAEALASPIHRRRYYGSKRPPRCHCEPSAPFTASQFDRTSFLLPEVWTVSLRDKVAVSGKHRSQRHMPSGRPGLAGMLTIPSDAGPAAADSWRSLCGWSVTRVTGDVAAARLKSGCTSEQVVA